MAGHKGKDEMNIVQVLGTMVKANIMAYVVTAIFVLFASIVLTYTDITPEAEGWIMTIGVCASAFIAGFDTAKVENQNGYRWGAVGGALYFVVFLVLGTVIDRVNSLSVGVILGLAAMVMVSSVIAGMISVNYHK